MKRALPLAMIGCITACTLEAPIIRQSSPEEAGGSAGQSFGGSAGDLAGGASRGGTFNADPYSENRYEWCLPPIFDPMHQPSAPLCDLPISMFNPWRWTVTILLDRSVSMRNPLPGSRTSKWVAVRNALTLMASEPTGFLDQWSLMTFAADDGLDSAENCVASSYRAAAVLPQAPPRLDTSTLIQAFDARSPSALVRPTAAALEAAIGDAQHNAAALNGVSTPVVVLITDGLPYGCSAGTERQQLEELVSTVNSPTALNYTEIYVVQLGDGFDLDRVADAGKTGKAFVVSGGEVDRQLVRIFRRILYPGPINCENWYGIPRSNAKGATDLDFDIRMDSVYTNSVLYPPHLESAEACAKSPAGGFWVADAGANQPYMVGLCPCTCAAMGTDRYTTLTMYCAK